MPPPPGLPVLRLFSLCRHAVATTPAGPLACVALPFTRLSPSTAAFPDCAAGRLPH